MKTIKKRIRSAAAPKSWGAVLEDLARYGGLSKKDARELAQVLAAAIRDHVWRHGALRVPELGTFRVKRRQPKVIVAPPGTESNVVRLQLPEDEVVTFRASRNWRRRSSMERAPTDGTVQTFARRR